MTTTLIIVFLNGSTTGSEVIVGDPTTYTSPNVAYAFTPINSDFIAGHYTNTGSTYSYNQPNPSQFIAAVQADNTLTTLLTLLQTYLDAMPSYAANPSLAKQLWAYLVSTYGPGGSGEMTSTQVTDIQNYAIAANVPLA